MLSESRFARTVRITLSTWRYEEIYGDKKSGGGTGTCDETACWVCVALATYVCS